jgi:hypothetical protein
MKAFIKHEIEIIKAGIVYLIIHEGKLIGSNSTASGAAAQVYAQFEPIKTNLIIR